MATGSVLKERKLARARARVEAHAVGEPSVVVLKPKAKHIPTKSGLTWLLEKGRITRVQYNAGQRYGSAARAAHMTDAAAIKSALGNLQDGAGGSGMTKLSPGKFDYDAAEWIAACKIEVRRVRMHFFDDSGQMALLDAICMKQMTPREIVTDLHQRFTEDLESSLRTCLTILSNFYGALDHEASSKLPDIMVA